MRKRVLEVILVFIYVSKLLLMDFKNENTHENQQTNQNLCFYNSFSKGHSLLVTVTPSPLAASCRRSADSSPSHSHSHSHSQISRNSSRKSNNSLNCRIEGRYFFSLINCNFHFELFLNFNFVVLLCLVQLGVFSKSNF